MKRTICILSVLAVLLLAVLAVGKSGVLSRKEETQEGEKPCGSLRRKPSRTA